MRRNRKMIFKIGLSIVILAAIVTFYVLNEAEDAVLDHQKINPKDPDNMDSLESPEELLEPGKPGKIGHINNQIKHQKNNEIKDNVHSNKEKDNVDSNHDKPQNKEEEKVNKDHDDDDKVHHAGLPER